MDITWGNNCVVTNNRLLTEQELTIAVRATAPRYLVNLSNFCSNTVHPKVIMMINGSECYVHPELLGFENFEH